MAFQHVLDSFVWEFERVYVLLLGFVYYWITYQSVFICQILQVLISSQQDAFLGGRWNSYFWRPRVLWSTIFILLHGAQCIYRIDHSEYTNVYLDGHRGWQWNSLMLYSNWVGLFKWNENTLFSPVWHAATWNRMT